MHCFGAFEVLHHFSAVNFSVAGWHVLALTKAASNSGQNTRLRKNAQSIAQTVDPMTNDGMA